MMAWIMQNMEDKLRNKRAKFSYIQTYNPKEGIKNWRQKGKCNKKVMDQLHK